MILHYTHTNHSAPLAEVAASICRDRPPAMSWVEPALHLPRRDGKPQPGRLPGFRPLIEGTPEANLPLAEARLYYPDQWLHLLASPSSCREVRWSESSFSGAKPYAGEILVSEQSVLLWRGRELVRFGLTDDVFPEGDLRVRLYSIAGQLLTWQILMEDKA
jgi:hypothetical protein